jgi:hypothetical protein
LSGKIVGEWQEGSLNDGGELIELLARDGTSIAAFTFGDNDPWPGRADGKGSTLEYIGASTLDVDTVMAQSGARRRNSMGRQESPVSDRTTPSRSMSCSVIPHCHLSIPSNCGTTPTRRSISVAGI